MFLHIGKDVVLQSKNIIGIFDIESLEKSNISKTFLEDLKNKNLIYNVSDGVNKSLVISKDNDKIKGYISNISSTTLNKRINMAGIA